MSARNNIRTFDENITNTILRFIASGHQLIVDMNFDFGNTFSMSSGSSNLGISTRIDSPAIGDASDNNGGWGSLDVYDAEGAACHRTIGSVIGVEDVEWHAVCAVGYAGRCGNGEDLSAAVVWGEDWGPGCGRKGEAG